MSFTCSICGQEHPGPPTAYSSTAPARWFELTEDQMESSTLDGDMCSISAEDEREFFLRANVELEVTGAEDPLVFSAWVKLSPDDMARIMARWESPGRDSDPAYPGVLANDLPGYPQTIGLEVEIHTREVGDRSRAVITPTDHPLADQQWEGMSPGQLQGIAEVLAHPTGPVGLDTGTD